MRVAKDKKATDAYDGNIYKLELGDCGKPISESRRGERGDEYYVKLNIVKYELENLIGKGGGGMNHLYTLRIDTVWDFENS